MKIYRVDRVNLIAISLTFKWKAFALRIIQILYANPSIYWANLRTQHIQQIKKKKNEKTKDLTER